MNRENPNAFENKYHKMIDDKINQSTQEIIDDTNQSAERCINSLKILEQIAAGDQATIDELIPFFKNKDGDQKFMDVSQYIIDEFGNPISPEGEIDHKSLIELCKKAFEKMLNEDHQNYYRKNNGRS